MNTQQEELTFEKVWRMFQETDRKFQETDRKFEKTQQVLARQFQETSRLLQRLEQNLEKTRQQVSELTGSWGKFVESMVEPALIRVFTARGIELEGTATRVKRRYAGRTMEVDILGVNRTYVVAVEVKTTLNVEGVKDHVQRLQEFKDFFPEYQTRRVIGAVAGMRIEQEADKYASRQGLFVLAQSGDVIQLLNDAAFEPQVW